MTTPDQDSPRDTPPPAGGPSWAGEPCPPWCTRAHDEDDHPEDRYHQGEPSFLPVLAGTTDQIPMTRSLSAVSLVIRKGRYFGEVVEWLALESDDGPGFRLLLTLESARALADHLCRELGLHEPG